MHCITILLQLDQQTCESIDSKTLDEERTMRALFELKRVIRERLHPSLALGCVVHVQYSSM
jgi:hypothetical protein